MELVSREGEEVKRKNKNKWAREGEYIIVFDEGSSPMSLTFIFYFIFFFSIFLFMHTLLYLPVFSNNNLLLWHSFCRYTSIIYWGDECRKNNKKVSLLFFFSIFSILNDGIYIFFFILLGSISTLFFFKGKKWTSTGTLKKKHCFHSLYIHVKKVKIEHMWLCLVVKK